MTEEIFDVCDADDNVIGQRPRSEVHALNLVHRAVHVFLFNTRGELLLQMRSATKDQFPSTYTSSTSGHVAAGDTYTETAPRELLEELGLRCGLEWVGKLPASKATAYEHTVLFRTVTDVEPQPDPGEVASVEFCSLEEVARRMKTQPELFSPAFATLFRWYTRL